MSNLQIRIEKRGVHSDIVVIHVRGALDTIAAYTFQEQVQVLLNQGIYKYIINLERLEYISSAGIGIFPGMASELRSHHGALVFVNVPLKTRKLFDMIGLTTLFKIEDDLERAIEEFESDEQ